MKTAYLSTCAPRTTATLSKVAYNVVQGDQHYDLTLIVPGFSREEIQMRFENGLLIVTGKKPEMPQEGRLIRQGFQLSDFENRFNLPKHAIESEITAQVHQGILAIRIPLAQPIRHQITVN